MKRILFFIPTLGHGGAERVLVNLVNHMNLDEYEVTVQTMFDVGIYKGKIRPEVRYIPGLKYYFRGNTKIFKLFSPKQLYKFYIKEHYDVIISYLEGPSARIISGCDNPKTKLVSWIHCEQVTGKAAAYSYRNVKEAKVCSAKFDQTVCVSQTVLEDFTRIYGKSIPTCVIYNTVESEVIRKMKEEKISDLMLNKNEINVCSVAKLIKTKGFDRLVNILKRLRDDGFPVHIYILGVGEQKQALEKMLEQYDMGEFWTFLGFKNNPYKYVASMDLYVCSSHREGFSTAVTEALIVGTPVVSTNCSGAIELLGENNEYGIVTENNEDALYEGVKLLIENQQLMQEYKEKTIERGKKFDCQNTVQDVELLLQRLIMELQND